MPKKVNAFKALFRKALLQSHIAHSVGDQLRPANQAVQFPNNPKRLGQESQAFGTEIPSV